MNLLAIEASAKVAGAAVMKDDELVAEEMTCSGLTHSQTLMPMVESVMRKADLTGEDIDAIVFTNGPGSFTGLRIGAATAKGLALGWGKPVLPLSTLEVLAYSGILHSGLIVPVMDARRSQVYTAVYRAEGSSLQEILQPTAMGAQDLLSFIEERGEPALLLGDVQVMKENDLCIQAPEHLRQIRAGAALSLGRQKLLAGEKPIPSDQVSVNYLRKPQAEREREAALQQKHNG